MTDEEIERLQTKIAFLEHAHATFSDVLYRQQRELAALEAKVAVLTERLRAAQSEERPRSADEERPPHY